jgi:hypothetical protein
MDLPLMMLLAKQRATRDSACSCCIAAAGRDALLMSPAGCGVLLALESVINMLYLLLQDF